MVLGDKVILAASESKEEGSKFEKCTNEENNETNGIDEDCFCVCFCEEGEDGVKDNENLDDKEEESAELVDQLAQLRESCAEKAECVKYKNKLEECTARVESRSKTSETCAEELMDFMHCVDHCASKCLFSKLK